MVTYNNWLNWPEIMHPGPYEWQIRTIQDEKTFSLNKFNFTVHSNATPFLVPATSQLLSRIVNAPRPRIFPRGQKRNVLESTVLFQRRAGWGRLARRVALNCQQELEPEPVTPTHALQQLRDKRFAAKKIRSVVGGEARRMLEAGFAYMICGNRDFLQEAKRRALHLAAWDSHGATGFQSQDKAFRNIAFSLAVIYDWLFNELLPSERNLIARVVNERMEKMYNIYIKSNRLEHKPYDSHGWIHLGHIAVIAAIMAGDSPQADEWARETIPLYFNSISPWGW